VEGQNGVEVTFKVERVWKGKTSEQIIVHTGPTEEGYTCVSPQGQEIRGGVYGR